MPAAARLEPGHPVRVEFTKWDGRPTRTYDGVYLGADEHGEWLGHVAGTVVTRRGGVLTADVAWVTLVPHRDAAHVVTFNAPGNRTEVYVDVTTPPEWDDSVLRAVDLDLDVVRMRDGGGVFLEDEDQFEAHQLEYGYPSEIITLAEESAERVLAAVRAGLAPYDETGQHWLDALAVLSA